MRKLCFVLTTLLLTTPAFAGVTISCEQAGAYDANVVVSYEASDDANLPRGFGMNIMLNNDETITGITSASGDYWVYPGTINISGGAIIDYGDPVAPQDPCFPGRELGGIDTNGMTIEMGSLYNDPCDPCHPSPPPTSGELLRFTVSGDCNVSIEGNAARGNVVLETTVEASVVYTGCEVVVEPPPCFPEAHPDYGEWVLRGSPSCWCNPRQCHGDAASDKQGTSKKGYYYVGDSDLLVIIPSWKVLEPPKGSGILGKVNGSGVLLTCADFAHDKQGTSKKGYYYVGDSDLLRYLPYWKALEPPKGSGTPADCLNVP